MSIRKITKTFIEKSEWGNYMMEPTHPEDVYDKDSFIEVLEIAAG